MQSGPAAVVERLLAPLNEEQQQVIDLIAQGFRAAGGQWPIFDFLEGSLDFVQLDAWAVLESLPRAEGHGEYCAAWWPRRPGQKPAPDQQVGLTVLGLYHAKRWPQATAAVSDFLTLLQLLADRRRTHKPSPIEVRMPRLVSTEDLVTNFVPSLPGRFLYDLMDREPATSWGVGASISGDDDWYREIPRYVLIFSNVREIKEYIADTVDLVYQPPSARPMAAPSPLDLVAAIDYLDAVWRLAVHGGHLFELHSAQRTAQLAFAAENENEFQSRLTALGEILRSFQLPAQTRLRKERDKPLNALAEYLVSKLPDSETRLRHAIDTLHAVIAIRDAGQHSAAGSKGASALVALGIGFPPASWPEAWATVSGRTIEALDAIREELATLAH